MNRELLHELLDLCIDVTEKIRYRANYEALNVSYRVIIWLFDGAEDLVRSYHMQTVDEAKDCIKDLKKLLETEKALTPASN